MEMRLDKLLGHYWLGTRKEVKKYIKKGDVKVNSQIIKKDDFKVDIDKDIVTFQDELIQYKPYVYIMLNKPAGYVSATRDLVHQTVVDLVEEYENYDLFPKIFALNLCYYISMMNSFSILTDIKNHKTSCWKISYLNRSFIMKEQYAEGIKIIKRKRKFKVLGIFALSVICILMVCSFSSILSKTFSKW